MTDRTFRWIGENAISCVEILNVLSNSDFERCSMVRDGLNDDFVQIVRTQATPIDAIVNVYSTPHDQMFGRRTDDAVLVHTYVLQMVSNNCMYKHHQPCYIAFWLPVNVSKVMYRLK